MTTPSATDHAADVNKRASQTLPNYPRRIAVAVLAGLTMLAVFGYFGWKSTKPSNQQTDSRPVETSMLASNSQRGPDQSQKNAITNAAVTPAMIRSPENSPSPGGGDIFDQVVSTHGTSVGHGEKAQAQTRRDVGADQAVPTRNGANLFEEAYSSATVIKKVSNNDTLILINREPRKGWYDVIDVRSGREGWVQKNDVDITLSKEAQRTAKFSEEYLGTDSDPRVDVVNKTGNSLELKVDQTHYTVQPKSQISVSTPPGTFGFYATEPGIIPALGSQEFKRGYQYTWTFWIETRVVPLP
jgi:hypothetical protein